MYAYGTLFPIQNRTSSYQWYISVYYYTSAITTLQGDIYYRESRDFLERSRATSLIRKHKNDLQFTSTYLWIITWDDVPEYSFNNKVSTEGKLSLPFRFWTNVLSLIERENSAT